MVRSYSMLFVYYLGLSSLGVYLSHYINGWLRRSLKTVRRSRNSPGEVSLRWLSPNGISKATQCTTEKRGLPSQSTSPLNGLPLWSYLSVIYFTGLFDEESTPDDLYRDENHQEVASEASYRVERFVGYEDQFAGRPHRKNLFHVYVEK